MKRSERTEERNRKRREEREREKKEREEYGVNLIASSVGKLKSAVNLVKKFKECEFNCDS